MQQTGYLEKQDLFEARQNGYLTYRIPGLIATSKGTVIVSTEGRAGRGGDYGLNDVLMRRSTDGGLTFEPPVVRVHHEDYGEGPISNFVMIADRDGEGLQAVFCHDYARVFSMQSVDDGASFNQPADITDVFEQFRADYSWRVCATGPGHGLQLRNGRMIIPVWLSDGSGSEFGSEHRGHRPSIVSLIYSDDRGSTWQRGEIVCRDGDAIDGTMIKNPNETVGVEHSDGRVMFNIRSESRINRRLVAVSPDGVSGWQVLGFNDALLEPVCMASMLRYTLPTERKHGSVLFANPDNLENEMIPVGGHLAHDRKRLTIKVSEDDGKTWPLAKVLEKGPAGYSDLARLADGPILCLYECGIITRMGDDRYLRLARFNMDWVASTSKPI